MTKKRSPFKVLFGLYGEHRARIALAILFYIIKSSPSYAMPYVLASIINIVSSPAEASQGMLWLYLGVITILIVQNIPMHLVHTIFFSKAVRHIEADLRSRIVRKLQQLSMAAHGELNAGRLQSKVLRDVEAIDMLSRQGMVALVPALLNILIATTLTLYHSLFIASFFIMTIPTALLIVGFFSTKIRKTNREFRTNIETMSGKVSETMEMIPVTRAHGLEDMEQRKVDIALSSIKRKGYRLDILEAYFGSSNWVAFQLLMVGCLALTSFMALKGHMPIGNIAMYQGYFAMILGGVTSLLNVYPQIAKGYESLYSVTEILLSGDTEEYKGRRFPEQLQGHIEFHNVSFGYRGSEKHAITDLSIHVRAGERIAFVGESGSGKSTILSLVVGFYKPQSGCLSIDGIPLEELDIRKYRQSLAMVSQNNILFAGTIRDNITYGLPTVSEEQLAAVVEAAHLSDLMASLPDGLDTTIGERGGMLSGGQRQRIAIARAMIRNPQIIILDEATSALDNKSEHHVQMAMERLTRGRTTLIVAHRLSTVRDADRIVVMNKGQIVEIGSYDELLQKRGAFYELSAMHG